MPRPKGGKKLEQLRSAREAKKRKALANTPKDQNKREQLGGAGQLKKRKGATSAASTMGQRNINMVEEVCHTGGCHCGAVRFKVHAPSIIKAIDCNCSICRKKQNIHFIVPESKFELTKGEENLTTYTFNTGVAKHTFCKTCGVQSFYRPRSNPDGYGVMPHCLDPDTLERVDIEKFEGDQWEKNIVNSDIASRSKLN